MVNFYLMRFIVWLALLALIVWGMFRPESPPDPFAWVYFDKLLHLGAFLSLSLVTLWTFERVNPRWTWLALMSTAVGLEWLQSVFQPVRQFDALDVLANLSGLALAWVTGWLMSYTRRVMFLKRI